MTQKLISAAASAGAPPAGKVSCLLCGGFISVSGGDRARFVDHMTNEHDAKTDCHEVLLAACVLDAKEKGFLVKTTSTRLDTIGRGKTPNYSDSFVTKLTASLPTNTVKQTPAAPQRAPPRRIPPPPVQRPSQPSRGVQPRRAAPFTRVPVQRGGPRPAPVQTSPQTPPVLRGNSSISFSRVDMRRKCNICSISLPNPTALVTHMNKNHFNLPGGINIVTGSGETISSSNNSPSRRTNPISPAVQKLANNLRKVEPRSRVIDKSKLKSIQVKEVPRISPQRNAEKKSNKMSTLKNSGIVIEKVPDAQVTDNDEILVMEEDPLEGGQETVTNSDYECSLCNKKLASSADLKLHRNELHGEQNPPEDPTQEKLRNEIDKLETLELLDNLVNFLDEK